MHGHIHMFRTSVMIMKSTLTQRIGDIKVHTAVQTKHSPNQEWTERGSSSRRHSSISKTTSVGNSRYGVNSTNNITTTTNGSISSVSNYHDNNNPDRTLSFNLNSEYTRNSIRRKELHDQPQLPHSYWNYSPYKKPSVDRNYQHDLSYPQSATSLYYSLPSWYSLRYRRYPREEPLSIYNDNTQLPWNYKPKCRSCGRPLLQDSFCADDFVMRVYIYKESIEPNGQRYYLAYIYEVYKDIKQFMQPTHFRQIIYNCDRFQTGPVLGEIYLITGIYVSDVPHVDSCSWKSPWSQVTKEQKRYLRKRYALHCGTCRLQRVLYVNPVYHRDPNTCYVPISPNSNELMCRDKFSLCQFSQKRNINNNNHNNRCKFTNNKSYRICKTWSTKQI
ncbi:unnamed protein product [Trichobilharzia szidati]|nr:unnamed protein product [Trichobilharzia szidati]